MLTDELMAGVDLDGYVTDNPDGSKTLTLDEPFDIQVSEKGRGRETQTVSELTFRRPKLAALDLIERARPGQQMLAARAYAFSLISDPAGLRARHIDDLDVDDGLRAVAVALGFLSKLGRKANSEDGGTLPPD